MDDFKTSAEERDSALWQRYTKYLKVRLEDLSRALERRNLTQTDAEFIRGQIHFIRSIIETDF